ncbi:hypothetical protein BN1708_017692 [Verticillium longisporum]|uniref:Uncharacterized protein n=1 Tax=Verticillium longisporum TaxID=100787 RepID=A0A0G4L9P2_VERLO|nr:hypothetical protein BN1708_017692 [Verticillium longisporum]
MRRRSIFPTCARSTRCNSSMATTRSSSLMAFPPSPRSRSPSWSSFC